MSDISIRQIGHAGRITLQRPEALNAMTADMCSAIEQALLTWRDKSDIELVIIDAEGDRAFCSGGDISELYKTGSQGDYAYGQAFWAAEYRLNALIYHYPKPYIAFMQGFTMGGGVGISCHGSHRIVGETSQIAMPECGIGLIPDVGGSYILACAPGYLGEYLGLTAARMAAADAIYAGFADHFIPQSHWKTLIETLEKTGNTAHIVNAAQPAPSSDLKALQTQIDRHFSNETLAGLISSLTASDDALSQKSLKMISRNAPLSMASTILLLRQLRDEGPDIYRALRYEYRFTARAMEFGDFLEGVRAAIIDKDRNPNWQFNLTEVPQKASRSMLTPLGALELNVKES